MSASYSALVLLREPWFPEDEVLRTVLAQRFAELGELGAVSSDPDAGLMALELGGVAIGIERRSGRMPYDPLDAPVQPERDWDCAAAVAGHTAHLRIGALAAEDTPVSRRQAAALVVALAGVLTRMAEAEVAFVPASGALLSPTDGMRVAHAVMNGVSPLEAWMTLYALRPREIAAIGEVGPPQGAYTTGLAALIGREIELAPLPVPRRQALDRLIGAAWQVLDGDGPFTDRQELRDPDGDLIARVRLSEGFLRKGVPAFVLVGEKAVVDARRLRLKRGVRREVLSHVLPAPAVAGSDGGDAPA